MSIEVTSMHIVIDGRTYALREVEPPEKRRLILSLVRYFDDDVQKVEDSGQMLYRRSQALKVVFASRFPDAAKFREVSCMFPQFSEWKYVLSDAQKEHIEWAESARACGLVDSVLVDYGE